MKNNHGLSNIVFWDLVVKPKINKITPDKILPAYGSYAAEVICEDITYQGMMYIGKSADPFYSNNYMSETEFKKGY